MFLHLTTVCDSVYWGVSGQTHPLGRPPPPSRPLLGRLPLAVTPSQTLPSGQTPSLGTHPLPRHTPLSGQTPHWARTPWTDNRQTTPLLLECILVN